MSFQSDENQTFAATDYKCGFASSSVRSKICSSFQCEEQQHFAGKDYKWLASLPHSREDLQYGTLKQASTIQYNVVSSQAQTLCSMRARTPYLTTLLMY